MPAPAEPRCPICMELVPLDELECPNDDCRNERWRAEHPEDFVDQEREDA